MYAVSSHCINEKKLNCTLKGYHHNIGSKTVVTCTEPLFIISFLDCSADKGSCSNHNDLYPIVLTILCLSALQGIFNPVNR